MSNVPHALSFHTDRPLQNPPNIQPDRAHQHVLLCVQNISWPHEFNSSPSTIILISHISPWLEYYCGNMNQLFIPESNQIIICILMMTKSPQSQIQRETSFERSVWPECSRECSIKVQDTQTQMLFHWVQFQTVDSEPQWLILPMFHVTLPVHSCLRTSAWMWMKPAAIQSWPPDVRSAGTRPSSFPLAPLIIWEQSQSSTQSDACHLLF